MKIVLDTNCLIPIIIPNTYGYDIWKAFRTGMYTLCVSTEILLEYEELLLRITEDKTFTEEVLSAIESAYNVEFVNPVYRFNLIKADPDDNKFVDCAITAGATYIVSNDRHFAELKNYDFPKVDVLTLTEFLNIVKSLSVRE